MANEAINNIEKKTTRRFFAQTSPLGSEDFIRHDFLNDRGAFLFRILFQKLFMDWIVRRPLRIVRFFASMQADVTCVFMAKTDYSRPN